MPATGRARALLLVFAALIAALFVKRCCTVAPLLGYQACQGDGDCRTASAPHCSKPLATCDTTTKQCLFAPAGGTCPCFEGEIDTCDAGGITGTTQCNYDASTGTSAYGPCAATCVPGAGLCGPHDQPLTCLDGTHVAAAGAACGADTACHVGVCIPAVCTADTRRCGANGVERCNAGLGWVFDHVCPAACTDGKCVDCAADAGGCADRSTPQYCDGGTWVDAAPCPSTAPLCSGMGECVDPQTCNASTVGKCLPGSLYCTLDGTYRAFACPAGCDDGRGCRECADGSALACDAGAPCPSGIRRCDAHTHTWAPCAKSPECGAGFAPRDGVCRQQVDAEATTHFDQSSLPSSPPYRVEVGHVGATCSTPGGDCLVRVWGAIDLCGKSVPGNVAGSVACVDATGRALDEKAVPASGIPQTPDDAIELTCAPGATVRLSMNADSVKTATAGCRCNTPGQKGLCSASGDLSWSSEGRGPTCTTPP